MKSVTSCCLIRGLAEGTALNFAVTCSATSPWRASVEDHRPVEHSSDPVKPRHAGGSEEGAPLGASSSDARSDVGGERSDPELLHTDSRPCLTHSTAREHRLIPVCDSGIRRWAARHIDKIGKVSVCPRAGSPNRARGDDQRFATVIRARPNTSYAS